MTANRELLSAGGFICRSVDRVLACLENLTEDELNWRPPAPEANSLYAIAVHVLSNTAENVLGVLCGEPMDHLRDEGAHEAEWSARGDDAEAVSRQWALLRERIQSALATLPASELDRERGHPRRGTLTGRDVLYVVARHAAEHQGQAELTRDLLNPLRADAPT